MTMAKTYYKSVEGWSALIGKVVKIARINDKKDLIELDTVGAVTIYLSATGDCCSRSWIEHVNGLDALLGAEVLGVVEREMPKPTSQEGSGIDADHIQF